MNQWLWHSLLLGWLNLSVLTPENRAIALHLSPLPWYVHIHCLPFLAPNQMSCDLQGLSSCHRAGLVFFSERQSCDEQSSLLAYVWLVFRHLVFKRKMMVWQVSLLKTCACLQMKRFWIVSPQPWASTAPPSPAFCLYLSKSDFQSKAKLGSQHKSTYAEGKGVLGGFSLNQKTHKER